MDFEERLWKWKQSRNYVAIGNLGEHITARLLISLDYNMLGAQDDFVGMVPEVLGMSTHANPEDFIAVDPEGHLVTVNSKASVSERACRITKSGDLSAPRLAGGQNLREYSTLRANLISPIDGDSFAQVVKVDLLHMKAQVFQIGDDGRLSVLDPPHDVAALAAEVFAVFPEHIPPPNVWDLV